MFADTPHLLKLLINHLLDQGVTLPDGTKVDKDLFTQVLKLDQGQEYRLLPKVSVASHLEVNAYIFLSGFVTTETSQ